MKRETLRLWTTRILLGFVLVTIGFSAGRQTAPLPPETGSATGPDKAPLHADHLVVVAAHMTFRCPECTQIEWYARELVESEFAGELADGRLLFRTVDYVRDTAFARKYNVSSSTLVLIHFEGGVEAGFTRLDEVWTRIRDRDSFFDYVRTAIGHHLPKEDAR